MLSTHWHYQILIFTRRSIISTYSKKVIFNTQGFLTKPDPVVIVLINILFTIKFLPLISPTHTASINIDFLEVFFVFLIVDYITE